FIQPMITKMYIYLVTKRFNAKNNMYFSKKIIILIRYNYIIRFKMTKKSDKHLQKNIGKNNDNINDKGNSINKSPISLLSEKIYKMNLLIKPGAKESRVTDISEDHIGLQVNEN